MLHRHRLKLADLQSEGRFLLHRQFIVAPQSKSEEPVQIVFDDNTTTIGYRTDSVDKLLKKYSSGADAVPVETEEPAVSSDSLVVFATLSEDDELAGAAAPLRFMGFLTVCALCSLQILGGLLTLSSEPEAAPGYSFLSNLCSVAVSVLFLGCIRWKSGDGFVLCSAFLTAHIVFALAQPDIWSGTEWLVSLNIVSLLCEGFLLYLSGSLRDVYSAHALLVRRRSS